ncbi:MAG: hypothetical protein AB1782_05240 [Cyanobacteriota bacterium]
MLDKLVQLTGLTIVILLIFIPLFIAIDEINTQTDMHYAEYTVDE